MDGLDYYKDLIVCDLCEDFYCTKCDLHWHECDCPGPMSEEGEGED